MGRHWDDMMLAMEIKLYLMANPGVGGLEIRVRAVNGVVFLSGAVQDTEKKSLAEQVARTRGAFEVKNDIQVLSEPTEAGEVVIVGLGIGSEDDAVLKRRVLGDMESDPRVNPFLLNVDVLDGVVYLDGFQESVEAKERAEEVARRVPSVLGLVSGVKVRDERNAA